jgi:hypothetical protein
MATLEELKKTRAQIAAEHNQLIASANLTMGRLVTYDEFIAAEEAILAGEKNDEPKPRKGK